jgi:hypothetical protein
LGGLDAANQRDFLLRLAGLMYGELASKAKGLIIKKQEYARYSARKWKNMKKSISGTLTDLATMVDANGNITPRSNMSTPMSTPPLSRKASKEDLTYSPPASPDNDPGTFSLTVAESAFHANECNVEKLINRPASRGWALKSPDAANRICR